MDTKVNVTCPHCGQTRSISKRYAESAGLCRSCNMKLNIQQQGYAATANRMDEIGRKGFKACAQKYGANFLIERVRNHLLADPSKPERVVMKVLAELGVEHYEREYHIQTKGSKPRNYLVDFMIWTGTDFVAIEINGEYVHQFHADRDERKQRLLRRRNYRVLVYTDSEVLEPGFAQRLQADLVGG